MKNFIVSLFIMLIFTLLSGCSTGIRDGRSMVQQFDDNALSRAALHKIQELNINSKDMRINFLTNNSYLLVIGQISTQQQMDAIKNKLDSLSEAKEVYNQLRINRPIGFAQQTKDSWITTQVLAQITANKAVNAFQIKVVTENAEVFLVGNTNSKMADIATTIASNVEGVKEVFRVFQLTE